MLVTDWSVVKMEIGFYHKEHHEEIQGGTHKKPDGPDGKNEKDTHVY